MKTEKILRKIGEIIISGQELTLKSFKEAGIKGNDISRLEIYGLLVKDKDGIYHLTNTDILYGEAKRLMLLRDYYNARLYLNALIAINPNHIGAHFQLFILSIVNYKFSDAVIHLDFLYQNNTKEYQIDYNLYWLLLSNLTTIPKEYQELVDNLTFNDLKIDMINRGGDINQSDLDLENNIRHNVLKRKYYQASILAKDLRYRHKKSTTVDAILNVLIRESYKEQNSLVGIEARLIKTKKYTELKEYLKSSAHKKTIGIREEYLSKLIDALEDIKSFKRLPHISVVYTNNVFDAIDCENYHLALSLSKKVSGDKKGSYENPIELLLTDIVDILDEMKKNCTTISAYALEKVLNALHRNDFIAFKEQLNNFLCFIHKEEYVSLITSLTELDFEALTENYKYTTEVLIKLNKRLPIDINIFITGFYNAINKYNFKLAHIFLNIITRFKGLGYDLNIEELTSFLIETENKYSDIIPKEENNEELNSYILNIIDQMRQDKSIAHIINISNEEYLEALRNTMGYKILSIGSHYVLMQDEAYDEKVDYITLRDEGIKLFKKGDYKKSAVIFEKLIRISSMPNIYLARYFKYLGVCYYNSGASSLASNYLSISDLLFKSLNIESNLDAYLDELSLEEDTKPSFIMEIGDFNYSNNISSIEYLLDIAHLFIGIDLNIEEISQEHNLNYDEITYIYILIAREYFQEGLIKQGDKYLKIASMRLNKPDLAKSIIAYLEKNKRFCQYQKDSICI